VPLARFTVCQVALLLPFVGPGFEALFRHGSARTRRVFSIAAIAMAVALPAAIGWFTFRRDGKWEDSLRPVSPTSTNPVALMKVARFLKAEADSAILDKDPGYRDIQIGYFSGLPASKLARYRHENFEQLMR